MEKGREEKNRGKKEENKGKGKRKKKEKKSQTTPAVLNLIFLPQMMDNYPACSPPAPPALPWCTQLQAGKQKERRGNHLHINIKKRESVAPT